MRFPKFMRLLAVASLAVTCVASHAVAKSSEGGGRIYNPEKLRTPKERVPKGRSMKRPSIPDPEERQPVRSSALIPNPSPSSRGGGGYQRNGKYFYETPRDIELKGARKSNRYNPTIPRPEPVGIERRAKPTTTTTSSSTTTSRSSSGSGGSSGVDYYNTGRATGGLGNFGDR